MINIFETKRLQRETFESKLKTFPSTAFHSVQHSCLCYWYCGGAVKSVYVRWQSCHCVIDLINGQCILAKGENVNTTCLVIVELPNIDVKMFTKAKHSYPAPYVNTSMCFMTCLLFNGITPRHGQTQILIFRVNVFMGKL